MAKGRKTGGRKKGIPNKTTAARQAEITASGLTPLDFMLEVMRDEENDLATRLDAAVKAAPYVHPRLASSDREHASWAGWRGRAGPLRYQRQADDRRRMGSVVRAVRLILEPSASLSRSIVPPCARRRVKCVECAKGAPIGKGVGATRMRQPFPLAAPCCWRKPQCANHAPTLKAIGACSC